MLTIKINDSEIFDNVKSEFIPIKGQTIILEHSLVSISKWESKWKKPFQGTIKTAEETIDYIKCMTITQGVDSRLYQFLSVDDIKRVGEYIEDPMTATIVNKQKSIGAKETVTSELIYYWMIALNIPVEFQKWHLNRLLMLIDVVNIKNTPPKKMSKAEMYNRNKTLNEARKQQLKTRG